MLNEIVSHFTVFYQSKVNHGCDGEKKKKNSLEKCIEIRDLRLAFQNVYR